MGLFGKKENTVRTLPRHIAIVMDGNGRWAKKRGLPRKMGHAAGAETFRRIATYCKNLGVEYLTVYAFSTENWKRSADEVQAIMALFEKYLHEAIDEMEREVRKTLGVELVIHYDPIVTDDEELSRIHTQVAEILQKVDPKLTVHDFRMVRGSRHTNVIFDLVLPFSMEERKQELRELVERELQTDGKEYHAVITFDTQAFNAPDDPCDDPEKT